MSRCGPWPALVAGAALLLPRPGAARQQATLPGMDASVDGVVTDVAVALTPEIQTVSGEAYEALAGRWRETLDVTLGFPGGYALGLGVSLARLEEQLVSGHAWATDVLVELLWQRATGALTLTAGPAAGYGRVSRPAYGEATHGFVAGGRGAVAWAVLDGFELSARLAGLWSSFNPPSFALPAPLPFGGDAEGQRFTFGLGVAYRWKRGAREGQTPRSGPAPSSSGS